MHEVAKLGLTAVAAAALSAAISIGVYSYFVTAPHVPASPAAPQQQVSVAPPVRSTSPPPPNIAAEPAADPSRLAALNSITSNIVEAQNFLTLADGSASVTYNELFDRAKASSDNLDQARVSTRISTLALAQKSAIESYITCLQTLVRAVASQGHTAIDLDVARKVYGPMISASSSAADYPPGSPMRAVYDADQAKVEAANAENIQARRSVVDATNALLQLTTDSAYTLPDALKGDTVRLINIKRQYS